MVARTTRAVPVGTAPPPLRRTTLLLVLLALGLVPGGEGIATAAGAAAWRPHALEAPPRRAALRAPLERGDGARLPGGSERVRELQALFAVLGYPLGREAGSGVYGVRTQGAVRYFQREHGLRRSGRVDARTLRRMRAQARALRQGRARGARMPSRPVPDPRGSWRDRLPELLALLVAIVLAAACLLPPRRRAPAPGDSPAASARAEVDRALAALARAPAAPAPLGAILLRAGALTARGLRGALAAQERAGGRLGEVLAATGAVDPRVVRAALGLQHGVLPLEGSERPAPRLPLGLARTARAVALEEPGGPAGAARVAFADPAPAAVDAVARALGTRVVPVLADERTLDALVLEAYAEEDAAAVRHALGARARTGRGRRVGGAAAGAVVLGALGAGLLAAPVPTALALVAGASLAPWLGLGPASAGARDAGDDEVRASAPESPRWTLLVPLVRPRAAAVEACVRACARLEYPPQLLQGLLLVPERDERTLEVLARTALPPWVTVVPVPVEGRPDPLALALHGLRGARGDLTVVLDPKAPPRPDELGSALRELPPAAPGEPATGLADVLAPSRPRRFARPGAARPRLHPLETAALRKRLDWPAPVPAAPAPLRLAEKAA